VPVVQSDVTATRQALAHLIPDPKSTHKPRHPLESAPQGSPPVAEVEQAAPIAAESPASAKHTPFNAQCCPDGQPVDDIQKLH
jgi:hypothetical protein